MRPGLLEGVSLLSAEAPRAPATRNFGAAVGEACAALGARVYRCCPLFDRSRCGVGQLEEGADEGVAVDRAAIEQGLASALEGGRSLDLLAVDAAGLFAEALASGADPQAALRLCMAGAWETTRALLGGVQSDAAGEEPRGERSGKTAAPGGRIVYIAPRADAGELAGGAQAGLENLARTLSVEWARYAITVVAIIPGERTSASEAAALTAYLGSARRRLLLGLRVRPAGRVTWPARRARRGPAANRRAAPRAPRLPGHPPEHPACDVQCLAVDVIRPR